jgi:hypothetical protein
MYNLFSCRVTVLLNAVILAQAKLYSSDSTSYESENVAVTREHILLIGMNFILLHEKLTRKLRSRSNGVC